jgi:hypothetical protein
MWFIHKKSDISDQIFRKNWLQFEVYHDLAFLNDNTFKIDEWGVKSIELIKIYLEPSLNTLEPVQERILDDDSQI